jgi:hypothetical protein
MTSVEKLSVQQLYDELASNTSNDLDDSDFTDEELLRQVGKLRQRFDAKLGLGLGIRLIRLKGKLDMAQPSAALFRDVEEGYLHQHHANDPRRTNTASKYGASDGPHLRIPDTELTLERDAKPVPAGLYPTAAEIHAQLLHSYNKRMQQEKRVVGAVAKLPRYVRASDFKGFPMHTLAPAGIEKELATMTKAELKSFSHRKLRRVDFNGPVSTAEVRIRKRGLHTLNSARTLHSGTFGYEERMVTSSVKLDTVPSLVVAEVKSDFALAGEGRARGSVRYSGVRNPRVKSRLAEQSIQHIQQALQRGAVKSLQAHAFIRELDPFTNNFNLAKTSRRARQAEGLSSRGNGVLDFGLPGRESYRSVMSHWVSSDTKQSYRGPGMFVSSTHDHDVTGRKVKSISFDLSGSHSHEKTISVNTDNSQYKPGPGHYNLLSCYQKLHPPRSFNPFHANSAEKRKIENGVPGPGAHGRTATSMVVWKNVTEPKGRSFGKDRRFEPTKKAVGAMSMDFETELDNETPTVHHAVYQRQRGRKVMEDLDMSIKTKEQKRSGVDWIELNMLRAAAPLTARRAHTEGLQSRRKQYSAQTLARALLIKRGSKKGKTNEKRRAVMIKAHDREVMLSHVSVRWSIVLKFVSSLRAVRRLFANVKGGVEAHHRLNEAASTIQECWRKSSGRSIEKAAIRALHGTFLHQLFMRRVTLRLRRMKVKAIRVIVDFMHDCKDGQVISSNLKFKPMLGNEAKMTQRSTPRPAGHLRRAATVVELMHVFCQAIVNIQRAWRRFKLRRDSEVAMLSKLWDHVITEQQEAADDGKAFIPSRVLSSVRKAQARGSLKKNDIAGMHHQISQNTELASDDAETENGAVAILTRNFSVQEKIFFVKHNIKIRKVAFLRNKAAYHKQMANWIFEHSQGVQAARDLLDDGALASECQLEKRFRAENKEPRFKILIPRREMIMLINKSIRTTRRRSHRKSSDNHKEEELVCAQQQQHQQEKQPPNEVVSGVTLPAAHLRRRSMAHRRSQMLELQQQRSPRRDSRRRLASSSRRRGLQVTPTIQQRRSPYLIPSPPAALSAAAADQFAPMQPDQLIEDDFAEYVYA